MGDDPFADSSEDDSLAHVYAKLEKRSSSKHFAADTYSSSDDDSSDDESSMSASPTDQQQPFDDFSLDDDELEKLLPKASASDPGVVLTTANATTTHTNTTTSTVESIDKHTEERDPTTTPPIFQKNTTTNASTGFSTGGTANESSMRLVDAATSNDNKSPQHIFSDDSDLDELEMEAAIAKALSAKPVMMDDADDDDDGPTTTTSTTTKHKGGTADDPSLSKTKVSVKPVNPYSKQQQLQPASSPMSSSSESTETRRFLARAVPLLRKKHRTDQRSEEEWNNNKLVKDDDARPIISNDGQELSEEEEWEQILAQSPMYCPKPSNPTTTNIRNPNTVAHSITGAASHGNENSSTTMCDYEELSDTDDWQKYLEEQSPSTLMVVNRNSNSGKDDDQLLDTFGFDSDQEPPRATSTLQETPMSIDQDDSDMAFGFETTNNESEATEPPKSSSHGHSISRAVQGDASESSNEDADCRRSEIDPSLYAPAPPRDNFPDPILHRFTAQNRPKPSRCRIEISKVFDSPVDQMWKSKFKFFNHMQSELANPLAYGDDNIVVSACTGAGKTTVFEMAMARFFAVDLQTGGGSRKLVSKRRKIVYISPSKALCEERFEDWSKRLSVMNIGIEIAVITGDGDPSESFHDLHSAHFVLTTPEKWDSLTRRWTENFFLFASVKLIMVDEVHLLGDESRGCCLESIVCRMKTIQQAASRVQVSEEDLSRSSYSQTTPEAVNSLLRFIAVSATLPNVRDVARFFDANEAYEFDESYRPVPLTTHVIGQGKINGQSQNQWHFYQNLERNVPEIINRFSQRRPTIVFCHSKKATETLADLLAKATNIGQRTNETPSIAAQTRVARLQRVLMQGIAYHHAGLEAEDRHLVEKAFLHGNIRALCATTTLAVGVNLPAHLVVIMGTKAWRGGCGYVDINEMSLLQMIGRAGRPGFDTSGTAVIMTDDGSKQKYSALASSGLAAAKSQSVGDKLVETINTEISQRVITSTESAFHWIHGTLYFIQLTRNPQVFGVTPHLVEAHLRKICNDAIQSLNKIGVVAIESDERVYPLEASHTMSQHLVEFPVMRQFSLLKHDVNLCQVLKAVSEIESIQRPVRRTEKKLLRETHKNLEIGYKIQGALSKVTINEPWKKVFVLLQVHVDDPRPALPDFTLRQEMGAMADFASRMLGAIAEYSIRGSKNGNVAYQSLKLKRSLACLVWNASHNVLRQIRGIGKDLAIRLGNGGISKFEDVRKFSDDQIEGFASRSEPFGSELRKACETILGCQMKVTASIETAAPSGSSSTISIQINHQNPSNASSLSTANGKTPPVFYTLLVYTDRPSGCLLHKEKISEPVEYTVPVPQTYGRITLRLFASIVGLDDSLELEGPNEVCGSSSLLTMAKKRPSNRIRNEVRSNTSKKKSAKEGNRIKSLTQESFRSDGQSPSTLKSYVTPSPKPAQSQPRKQPALQHMAQTTMISTSAMERRVIAASTEDDASMFPSSQVQHRPKATEPGSLRYQDRVMYGHTQEAKSMRVSEAPMRRAPNGRVAEDTIGRQTGFSEYAASIFRPTAPDAPVRTATQTPLYSTNSRDTTYRQQFQSSTEPARKRSANATADPNLSTSSNWKKTKYIQQKSQQRVFKNKRDNPFSLFQHDPNDSESMLSLLSSQNTGQTDSIIPEDGLRALDDVYRSHTSTLIPKNRAAPSFGTQQYYPRRRRERETQLQVLAAKAEEQRATWGASPSPATAGYRQDFHPESPDYHIHHRGSAYPEMMARPPQRFYGYHDPYRHTPPYAERRFAEPPNRWEPEHNRQLFYHSPPQRFVRDQTPMYSREGDYPHDEDSSWTHGPAPLHYNYTAKATSDMYRQNRYQRQFGGTEFVHGDHDDTSEDIEPFF